MTIVAQLLFAEAVGELVVLDAVILDGDDLAPGTPVTLRLVPPESPLIASLARSRLMAWAETGDVVDLRLRPRSRGMLAVVSDGRSQVSLDVTDPRVA